MKRLLARSQAREGAGRSVRERSDHVALRFIPSWGGDVWRRLHTSTLGRLATLASLFTLSALASLSACDVNSDPPLRDASDVREEASLLLPTTTITATSELAGIERVRGHLVLDIASGPIRLPLLTVIEGDLILVGTPTRTVSADLVLASLVRVGGSVRIAYTAGSAAILMPKLVLVGTHFELTNGSWSLDLPVLTSIGGDLRIQDATIASGSLESLETLGGSLVFDTTAFAEDLDLSGLESVARDLVVRGGEVRLVADRLLSIGGDLRIERTAGTIDLAGLRTVAGDARFESSIIDALSIGALRRVGDDLIFEDSSGAGLVALDLAQLEAVPGQLRVDNLEDLTSFSAAALPLLGSLAVTRNTSLAFLGLRRLARIEGDFELSHNGELTLVFDALTAIAGDFVIDSNRAMNGLLPKLTDVGRDLRFASQFTPYIGLAALQVVGGDVLVEFIFGSVEFDHFQLGALRQVGGSLTVHMTDSIDKLTFDALASVGSSVGDLVVTDNPDIVGLNLVKLTTVAGRVEARNNPRLPEHDLLGELEDVLTGSSPVICGNLGGDPCTQ